MMSLPLAAPLLLLLTPVSLAQVQVHVVDDDGGAGVDFTDLPPAVAAAVSGDVLLVKDGTYSSFAIDGKGLVVLSDGSPQFTVQGGVLVSNLPLGETVLLRGVKTGIAAGIGLTLASNAGSVRVEDCAFTGQRGFNHPTWELGHPEGYSGVEVVDSADVAFARCAILGGDGSPITDWSEISGRGGTGLDVVNSNLAFDLGTVTGGVGGSDWGGLAAYGGWGGLGVRLESGQLFAMGSELAGGRGGSGGTAWEWGGCVSGSPGGAGLDLIGGALHARATTMAGGPGGFGAEAYGCHNGPFGPDVLMNGGELVHASGAAVGYVAPAPLRVATPGVLAFTGTAGDVALLGLSGPQAGFTPLPFAAGALLLDPQAWVFVAGVVPPSGELSLPLQLNTVPGGGEAIHLHGQSLHVQLAGDVLLGAASALVVVGPAF